jgi:hypothetical protein
MKTTLAGIAASLAAAAAIAASPGSPAAPDPAAGPFKPLAFLAGHCYKAVMANGKDTDEHCFRWVYGGQALRDVHTVRGEGHPDYVGETTYFYDSVAKRLEYLYIENAGGVLRGTVESHDGAIVFPEASFLAGGKALTIRTRWTPMEDGYEAWSEMQKDGGWATLFKMKLTKSS